MWDIIVVPHASICTVSKKHDYAVDSNLNFVNMLDAGKTGMIGLPFTNFLAYLLLIIIIIIIIRMNVIATL